MANNITDFKNIAIIYSALVSTIALVWNIVSAVLKNRGKIEIECNNKMLLAASSMGTFHLPPELNITITNKGQDTRYMEQPSLKTSKNINGCNLFALIDFGDKYKFPIKLERGEKFNMEIKLKELEESIFKHIYKQSFFWQIIYFIIPFERPFFNVIAKDTIGKQYNSKRIFIGDCDNVLKAFDALERQKKKA